MAVNIEPARQVCLVAYSDSFQLRAHFLDYVDVAQEIARNLGVVLTDYTYHIDENLESEAELQSFDIDRLRRLSRVAETASIADLILWSDPGEKQLTSYWDFYTEMVDARRVYGRKFVYVQFSIERVGHLNQAAKFAFISKLLSSVARLGHLEYALVTVMDDNILPWLYFRGIPIPGLSSDDILNLVMWRRQIEESSMKLRAVYWGNLMSATHLSRFPNRGEFITKLTNLVGTDGITTINGDDLFFMLPSADTRSDLVKPKVEALLSEYDLLMQPDDETRRINSQM